MKDIVYRYSHSIASLVFTFVAVLFCFGMEASIAVIAFYFGREIAQAEQRGIKEFYNNHRANAPWYVGFEPRAWNKDSLINDALLPSIISVFIAVVV